LQTHFKEIRKTNDSSYSPIKFNKLVLFELDDKKIGIIVNGIFFLKQILITWKKTLKVQNSIIKRLSQPEIVR
jgi:hypothetical protein